MNDTPTPTTSHFLAHICGWISELKLLHWCIITVASLASAGSILGLLHNSAAPAVPTVAEPQVSIDVYDDSLQPCATAWVTELNRRFKVPTIAILCHGGGPEASRWLVEDSPAGGYGYTCESALALVDRTHDEHPDCVIVLLACNPCHVVVHGRPWLYYSPAEVWCVPDHAVENEVKDYSKTDGSTTKPDVFSNRFEQNPEVVGNSYEFIEAN